MQGFVSSIGGAQLQRARSCERGAVSGRGAGAGRSAAARRSRRARVVSCAAAAAPTGTSAGTIRVLGGAEELAVGDTVTLEYTPGAGSPFLAEGFRSTLLWTGGFNGWRGDGAAGPGEAGEAAAQTLNFPFTPLLNGSFRVSLVIPDFANSIDFAVVDQSGFAWDDNDGAYFAVPVKYRKRAKRGGGVEEYVAPPGEPVRRDLSAEQETSPVMVAAEEERLHRVRGEAALVGEEKGLGNILVNEARDTFERFDHGRMGVISVKDVEKALALLSLELEQSELDALIKKYVKDEEKCSMVEWMLIYAELELSDHGLDIV